MPPEPGVLQDKLDTEAADFLCSTASCDDAEEEEPEVTEQVVVAQATDFAALLKSWDAFLGNQDFFAIMESTKPLESQTHLS